MGLGTLREPLFRGGRRRHETAQDSMKLCVRHPVLFMLAAVFHPSALAFTVRGSTRASPASRCEASRAQVDHLSEASPVPLQVGASPKDIWHCCADALRQRSTTVKQVAFKGTCYHGRHMFRSTPRSGFIRVNLLLYFRSGESLRARSASTELNRWVPQQPALLRE